MIYINFELRQVKKYSLRGPHSVAKTLVLKKKKKKKLSVGLDKRMDAFVLTITVEGDW